MRCHLSGILSVKSVIETKVPYGSNTHTRSRNVNSVLRIVPIEENDDHRRRFVTYT